MLDNLQQVSVWDGLNPDDRLGEDLAQQGSSYLTGGGKNVGPRPGGTTDSGRPSGADHASDACYSSP
jgi:hypothetical protein